MSISYLSMHIQHFIKIHLFVLKILRKNKFLHQSRAITLLFINEFSPFAIPNHSLLISMSMQSLKKIGQKTTQVRVRKRSADGRMDGPTNRCYSAKRSTSHFSVHPYKIFVQTNELFCPFCLRAEILPSCFEATKLPNVMCFHQQPLKHYVCQKKKFIFATIYHLHRLVMVSQLMWIPPNFGHSSLIRVFAVCMKKAWVLSYSLSAQRRLIRLGTCPG